MVNSSDFPVFRVYRVVIYQDPMKEKNSFFCLKKVKMSVRVLELSHSITCPQTSK